MLTKATFQGHLDFPEALYELAADIGLCVSYSYTTSCVVLLTLGASDPTKLKTFAARQGVQGLRLPLQMCLAVSPCILFFDTLIHKRTVDRFVLLHVSGLYQNKFLD
jgi:hypothetical protein